MFDFTGCRFCFDVVAGNKEDVVLAFNKEGGEALDLINASFQMWAVDRFRGNRVDVGVEHGAETGELNISIPAMRAGVYDYELWAKEDTGEQSRVIYGVLNVESSELSQPEEASVAELRKLLVNVPEIIGEGLRVRWIGTNLATKAAREAVEAAELCRGVAEKIDVLEGKVAFIDGVFKSVIVANKETNTWWVCGEDTGCQLSGEDGKSPEIGSNGHWFVWVGGEWIDTGVSARGLDGDKVRRILIGNENELPSSGETCHGGVYYYIKRPGRYAEASITFNSSPAADIGLFINNVRIVTSVAGALPEDWAEAINAANVGVTASAYQDTVFVYAQERGVEGNSIRLGLGETLNGLPIPAGLVTLSGDHLEGGVTEHWDMYAWLESSSGASWQKVGEKNDIAGRDVYGLVQLGTDNQIKNGAVVGNNADGGLAVAPASYYQPGVVKLGETSNTSGAGVGVDKYGQLRTRKASAGIEGSVVVTNIETVGSNAVGFMADGSLGVRQASEEKEGVVKLSRGVDDTEGVARMGQLKEFAYSKEDVYTKKEISDNYPKADKVATKDELTELAEKMVEKNETWEGDIVLTQEQYDSLEEVNPRVKYFII